MPDTLQRKRIGAVWMDSRKVTPGDVFLALKSGQDDGHRYVPSALKAGACAAIVSRRNIAHYAPREQKKCIGVANPLKAIQRMAAVFRKDRDIPVVAITGSSGKTTTRQFVTTVLSAGLSVGNTETRSTT